MATTFEDLPGEIRNEIYRLALVHHNPIKLSRYNSAKNEYRHRLDFTPRTPKYKITATTTTLKGKQKRRVALSEVLCLSLLKVSKGVNHEASTILFGENCFVFDTAPALEHFCDVVGKRATALRDVEVKGRLDTVASGQQVKRLAVMAEPKRIVVAAQTMCSYGSIDEGRHLCPGRTWDAINSIILGKQSYTDHDAQSSVYRRVGEDEQLRRFDALEIDVSEYARILVAGPKTEVVRDYEERRSKFTTSVLAHWQQELEKAKARKAQKAGSKRS